MPRWDENKGLSLADLRDTKHAVIVASMAGKPLNFYLTLTPLRLIAAADKPALFQRERGRIGQRLGRRPFCVPFVGLFIRELKADDPNDAGEHCHGLLHLPDAVDAELILRAVSRDIDAQLQENKGYAGIMTRQAYMQKEREGQAEGWLKKNRVPRYTWEDPRPSSAPDGRSHAACRLLWTPTPRDRGSTPSGYPPRLQRLPYCAWSSTRLSPGQRNSPCSLKRNGPSRAWRSSHMASCRPSWRGKLSGVNRGAG